MFATTQGLGPFYPKIVYFHEDHLVFISDKPFTTEDEALKHAQQIVDILFKRTVETLDLAGFRGGA